ncbi:hypothetical protein K469DRAFT_191835 [Zopfia rhizophila CBS 207.26]|uniref:C2H2-type domain-containing protein n=1 Tax=Zopfia rhizophila CBS 207.26 TaxID=1314779 RepID=A0A6A6EPL2_9PEZI|nr:hypothetical protein K469DRAFT_191835 [Zopfia rhizophila CBS 207.26]
MQDIWNTCIWIISWIQGQSLPCYWSMGRDEKLPTTWRCRPLKLGRRHRMLLKMLLHRATEKKRFHQRLLNCKIHARVSVANIATKHSRSRVRRSNKHVNLKHNRRFQCPKTNCNLRPFGSNTDLRRHLVTVHSKSKSRIHCPYHRCHASFTRKDNMQKHVKTIHKKITP